MSRHCDSPPVVKTALLAVCLFCACVGAFTLTARAILSQTAKNLAPARPRLLLDSAGKQSDLTGSRTPDRSASDEAELEQDATPTWREEDDARLQDAILTWQEENAARLQDVFISVKTSGQFHSSRLKPVLDTWYTHAKEQTWFFTDRDDEELSNITNGHVINTNCSSTHHRKALCCKMAAEYDTFMTSGKKWFCHFDDDNYVNTYRLGELLSGYSSQQSWYLGKNSIKNPIEIMDRDKRKDRVSFWFGTGGAGFCISRGLALKMSPITSGGRFMRIGERIRLPDDVTMGYIIEHLLKTRLTVIDEFHSHLEQMRFVRPEVLDQQISFSYSRYGEDTNTLNLNTFNEQRDPTRFYSLHCLLHPSADFCPKPTSNAVVT